MRRQIFFFLISLMSLSSLSASEDAFENEVLELMERYNVPGVSIAIINKAEVIWHKALGVKNSFTHEPITEDTIFEGASFSKPFFAYAVMKLVEKGIINLDAPLKKYWALPDLQNDKRLELITARMVLDHTSGLPNWRPDGKPLEIYFSPGEKFSYSGEGYVYLQKVVEHLMEVPLDVYMKKNILDPLGMTKSSYVWINDYENLNSFAHSKNGTPNENSKRLVANAAASLYTNALDYSKFIIAFMKDSKSHVIQEMLTPQIRIEKNCVECTKVAHGEDYSPNIYWGLGWGLLEIGDEKYFWQWGNNPGFKCYVFSTLDGNRSAIIMTNSHNGLPFISELLQKITGLSQPSFKWLEAPY